MADNLPKSDRVQSHQAAGATHGLALRAHPAEGGWHEEPGLVATVNGYPEWSGPELERISREQGAGIALARAYQMHGKDLFDHLRGPFSLAIIDNAAGRALLAIDRFGVQPLCYGLAGDGALVFGSTTDSVRAHPAMGWTIRPQALYDYLYFIDRIPAPDTIYEEQKKLLPGQYLLFERGRLETRFYWRMPYAETGGTSDETLSRALVDRLREAVAGAIGGEDAGRVGAFLSGGLDSSTVLGFLAELSTGPPRSFTIGFETQGYDETEYAKLASDHFGGRHDVYYLQPQDVLDAIPLVSRSYDEPFANSSAIPAYFCALRAGEAGIDTMLAGDGGDELFAGNSRYTSDNVFDHYRRIPGSIRRSLVEPLAAVAGRFEFLPPARKLANYVRRARLSVPARLTGQNVFATAALDRIFRDGFIEVIDAAAPLRLAEEIYAQAPSSEKLNKMMYLDLRLTLADSDLRKVGRMCELAGVRVRYPFLDDDLAEFAARIPPGQMLRGGRLRGFFKYAVRDFLPPEILAKQKHGFGLPYFDLMGSYRPLNAYVCERLAALKAFSQFRPDYLDALIGEIRQGRVGNSNGVAWDLMMLAEWMESR